MAAKTVPTEGATHAPGCACPIQHCPCARCSANHALDALVKDGSFVAGEWSFHAMLRAFAEDYTCGVWLGGKGLGRGSSTGLIARLCDKKPGRWIHGVGSRAKLRKLGRELRRTGYVAIVIPGSVSDDLFAKRIAEQENPSRG